MRSALRAAAPALVFPMLAGSLIGIGIGTGASAHAQPPLHHISYRVTAEEPVSADIYYREADPPTWADYSHNPYVFSPGRWSRSDRIDPGSSRPSLPTRIGGLW